MLTAEKLIVTTKKSRHKEERKQQSYNKYNVRARLVDGGCLLSEGCLILQQTVYVSVDGGPVFGLHLLQQAGKDIVDVLLVLGIHVGRQRVAGSIPGCRIASSLVRKNP